MKNQIFICSLAKTGRVSFCIIGAMLRICRIFDHFGIALDVIFVVFRNFNSSSAALRSFLNNLLIKCFPVQRIKHENLNESSHVAFCVHFVSLRDKSEYKLDKP